MDRVGVTAFVALGSNLGDREAHLHGALAALGSIHGTRVAACSSFHETVPVGPPGQGPYLNAAAELWTTRTARELLGAFHDIEQAHGRDRAREARWGARTLDLDLLLYADQIIGEQGLIVPHPRMHERRFVLEPLAEIAPDAVHPVLAQTVTRMLDSLRRRR